MEQSEAVVNMEPLVSIIMPAYNCEKYIYETVSSIQRQTYTNWELILIDDGSKDQTGIICDNLSAEDNRIKVLHIKNDGVSNARNTGLNVARGFYITFIDSDDLWRDSTLEVEVSQIQGSDLLIFGYETFPHVQRLGIKEELILSNMGDTPSNFVELSNQHLINPVWNKLYKTEKIKELQVSFPIDLTMGEDLIFNLSYIKACKKIKVIPAILYKYRREYLSSLSNIIKQSSFVEQKRLKETTDHFFLYDKTVERKTSIDFVNTIIDMAVSSVGNKNYDKESSIRIMRQWFGDEYFKSLINSIYLSEIKQNLVISYMILHNKYKHIYYWFKIRKLLSWIKNKLRVKG